jgi:type VI secretion system secreted protein VgrG
MSTIFSQDNRLGKFHTDLGKDELSLLRFNGHDEINGLFHYRVEAIAETNDIEFDKLLGTHASVELRSDHYDTSAWFDGIVCEVEWMGARDNGQLYALHLKPWIYLMSLRQNQRIFHEMTVIDILKEVLDGYNSSGNRTYRMDNRKSYPVLEYTVQYRETDLAFVCRLMERFGISYFFTHGPTAHTMRITDTVDTCEDVPQLSREYLGSAGDHVSDVEHFWEWSPTKRITTGAIHLTDFHFKRPDSTVATDQSSSNTYKQGKLETYLFPGDLYPEDLTPGGSVSVHKGADRGKLKLNQAAALGQLQSGSGNTLTVKSGLQLKLEGDPLPRATGETFVCMRAEHVFVSPSYGTGGDNVDSSYDGSYLFQTIATPFVPRHVTPRSIVHGPQTAKVVGEGEIDVDEFGRILVLFPWDLDEANSMRCRVSQSWAGKGWGSMVLPRIGMEVVVEFIEGNPDQPLVTGCVYNATNMPHYNLPEEKTRTIFRTDCHEGEGFNEFSFEDKSGSEEIYVRAMRNMNALVGNNLTEAVDANKIEVVGNSKISEISNLSREVIGGSFTLDIGPGMKGTFKKQARTTYIDGGRGLGDIRPSDATNLFEKNGNDLSTKQGEGDFALTVERHRTATVGVDDTIQVGKDKMVQIGNDYIVDVGQVFKLTAGKRIILECGASKLEMDVSGTIKLTGVKIDQKASATFSIKGSKTDIN